jgi:ubiquinone/menaquinone biosynthesis C-methylase UbiE
MNDKQPAGHLHNTWINVDETDDPEFFVRFLAASRARALEFARKNPQAAFAHLQLEPGISVLDCGCGTGDMLAIIARLIAPGEAYGGDISQTMLKTAQRHITDETSNLHFEPMDAQSLAFPDKRFDRAMATQLLVHVPDPRLAFHEICRVTKHNGLVAFADMDWDTFVFGSSDKELGRRFTRLFSDGLRNGLVARQYAGWLHEEGFTNIQVLPQALVFDDWEFGREFIVEPSLSYFVKTGSMSPQEADAFVSDLASRSKQRYFIAASTFYTVTGTRS